MPMHEGLDLTVDCLGECRIDSPLAELLDSRLDSEHYVRESDRVLVDDIVPFDNGAAGRVADLAGFEAGGPRRKIFFDPSKTRVGIVTCGGLCPGLNDVIRGLVHQLTMIYGVRHIVGFRNGYQGFVPSYGYDLVDLTMERVRGINEFGGTILGTSRGAQDPVEIADCLERVNLSILFVIGGDGTLHGALKIQEEVARRGLKIAIVGIPKTIDNDIPFIDHSFGFQTATAAAMESIRAARVEAQSAPGGVGLVKLMGRHSGFIACYAALAKTDADFVLIPEVPFGLDGEHGLLAHLRRRVAGQGHAVLVVAEGAGQELLAAEPSATDASGNVVLQDVATLLRRRITDDFAQHDAQLNIRYLDPSYQIRSVPANPSDSVYCVRLAQAAVHAGMAGRTGMVVGRWHGRFVHLPIPVATNHRNTVDPHGDLWLSVLEATGQPLRFG
jgi:6-phosphofructokinase 1